MYARKEESELINHTKRSKLCTLPVEGASFNALDSRYKGVERSTRRFHVQVWILEQRSQHRLHGSADAICFWIDSAFVVFRVSAT